MICGEVLAHSQRKKLFPMFVFVLFSNSKIAIFTPGHVCIPYHIVKYSSHYLTLPDHPLESVFGVIAEAALTVLPSHE